MATWPLIGITAGLDPASGSSTLSGDYAWGIAEAGGIPVMLPVPGPRVAEERWLAVLDRLDGILFSGGPDIDPAIYGQAPLRQLGSVSPERDCQELSLARQALARDLPLLGICRGVQTLAVAAGGSLYQDLESQVQGVHQHRQNAPRWHTSHGVRLEKSGTVGRAYGAQDIRVNSFHHQAVAGLPPGFVATGWASDGVIEAIESTKHRLAFGVQWHPECIWAHDPAHLAVFRRLVQAAASGSS